MSRPTMFHTVFVNCRPEDAWRAITDGDMTVQYFYGTKVESTWEADAAIRYLGPDGEVVADGVVIAIDAPHRLEMSFHPRWNPDLDAEGPVREVWTVETADDATKVSVETWDVDSDSKTYAEFIEGFPYILSAMKTVLESGEPQ